MDRRYGLPKSSRTRNGAIPTRKAAPLIKRKNLPTFCTVVSGFWFTSAICANPEYQYRLVRAGSQAPPDQRSSRSQHDLHRDGGDDAAGTRRCGPSQSSAYADSAEKPISPLGTSTVRKRIDWTASNEGAYILDTPYPEHPVQPPAL